MSRTTSKINKITTTITNVSCKVLLYALVIFLMYEGITRGYGYGHEIFAPTAVAEAPGTDYEIVIEEGTTVSEAAQILKDKGLVKDDKILVLQSKVYEYKIYPGTYTLNTSETSKEMLKILDGGGKNSGDGKK
ncbi:MAG: aminodeoxychorismate lyase [Clostridium sp.]